MRPSRGLAASVLGAHAAAALCAVAVLPGVAGAGVGLLVLALGVAAAADRALLLGRRAPHRLELRDGADGTLESRDGQRVALLRTGGQAQRFWAFLEVADPLRRRVLVVPGMLGEQDFRRLRLWALWGRLPATAAR